MLSVNYKKIYFIIIGLVILLLDQTTKYLINNNYDYLVNKDYILFSIDFIRNYGQHLICLVEVEYFYR